jgi:histidinol-phosphate phosphatase family protein
MGKAGKRAVFLDRDGTLIVDVGYPRDPRQVRLLPGSGAGLAQLRRHGFLLVLVSNQSGVGRGLVTAAEAEAVHREVVAHLGKQGVRLDAAYYCPHAPEEGCACRKPSPVLLTRAAEDLRVDLARSFMVGDKLSDIAAGQRAGCRTVLLRTRALAQEGAAVPDKVAADWSEVVHYVLNPGKAKA